MDFEKLIDMYPPESASGNDEAGDLRHYSSKKLKTMMHQDQIDLHGYTLEAALAELQEFLAASSRQGLRKVLVIHGKGYHSDGKPVLAGAVRRYLESCPLAGQLLVPPAKYGGSGALWVMLRGGGQRSR